MRFSPQYTAYINSGAWQVRRLQALKRAGNRCQVCGRTSRLQVHHVTYRNLGHEADHDLTALCWECHTLFTWYSRFKRFFAWLGRLFKWIFGNR